MEECEGGASRHWEGAKKRGTACGGSPLITSSDCSVSGQIRSVAEATADASAATATADSAASVTTFFASDEVERGHVADL